MECQRLRITISGNVQGVGFRFFAMETAKRLGITGWIRNEPDGTISSVACGSAEGLAQFLEECRKGPPAARVESLATHEYLGSGDFEDFRTL